MSASNSFVQGSSTKASGSNVPINHLDYGYVKDCTNAKELEEIIKVLRSGSEGCYPQLEEYTEKKLKEINPKSEVLRKDNPAQSMKDLDADTQKIVTEDLLNWTNEANNMDLKLKDSSGQSEENNVDGLPPVRSKKTIVDSTSNENVEKPPSSGSKKTVKPRNYEEWDKFDVEKELENLDEKEESSKPIVSESKSSIKVRPVSTKGLNAEERLRRAKREKEKGNEAFRAQDYEEAVVYYTNSLEYEPTAASYNNRAAAELKIERFSEAIDDCNKVFELEPNNLKGFLRRGLAYKALKQYDLALKDFNSMLQIEPGNKRAKELLAEVNASKRGSVQSRPEEKNATPDNDVKHGTGSDNTAGANTKKKGQRLKIVEVDNSDDVTGENRGEPLVVEPWNEESYENGLPDQVEEKNLEEGIMGDIEGINGNKLPQEGLSEDIKVNDGTSVDDQNIKISESNFEDMKDNVIDNGAAVELKSEPEKVIESQQGGISGISGGNSEHVENGVETLMGSKDEVVQSGVKTDTKSESEILQKDADMQEDQNEKEIVLEIPENVKGLTKEGNYLYKMGHHSEALVKYSECVKHLWEDRDSYASAVSSLLNNKAACYFKMGDCKQCISECNQSLQLVNNNVKALLRRGVAYEILEKYAKAFNDFNRARLIDCSNRVAQDHCSRVIKHLEMIHGKSWRKKILEMDNADDSKHHTPPDVDKNSRNPSQVNLDKGNKKTLLQKAGLTPDKSLDAGKGVPESSEAGESQEDSGASVKAKFLKLKESGNSLVKKGKHEEAIKQYTECMKLCPEEVAIYTNRALCYLQLSKTDLAESDCNAALKIQSDNIKALFRRGKARKGLGRYREASNDLVQVLKLDSKNGPARSELTSVLALLKKEKKEEEKSTPKRKKIVIQDVEGDEEKKPGKATEKQSNISTSKKKENPKVVKQDNTKATESSTKVSQKDTTQRKGKDSSPVTNQKANKQAKNSTQEVSRKNNGKKKNSSQKGSPKDESKMKESSSQDVKESSSTPVKYNLKSAFQFQQAWKGVKNDVSEYLNLLKQLNLADIPKVISNRLDTDMIKSIFEALHFELKTNGDVKFVYQFLHKLMSVERFEMTLMFLSEAEKEALRTTFDDLTKKNNEQTGVTAKNLSLLKEKYFV